MLQCTANHQLFCRPQTYSILTAYIVSKIIRSSSHRGNAPSATHALLYRSSIHRTHTRHFRFPHSIQSVKRIQRRLRLGIVLLILHTVHPPARKLDAADGPIDQVDMHLHEIGYRAQQIHQFLHPIPDPRSKSPPAAIVLDHSRVVVHMFDIDYIVLDAHEIPLRKVIQERVRPTRCEIACSSPALPEQDLVKGHVDDECVLSVDHVDTFLVYLVARRQDGGATAPPDYVVSDFAVRPGRGLLHLPYLAWLADQCEVVFAAFEVAIAALEAYVESGSVANESDTGSVKLIQRIVGTCSTERDAVMCRSDVLQFTAWLQE